MKPTKDYVRDIAEIRSMMERSSKFLSLSGWAGIMAGIYALAGAYMAYSALDFYPDEVAYAFSEQENLSRLVVLGIGVLVLAVGTAAFLSHKKARDRGEKIWNVTSRRLLVHMSVPLVTGGLLILLVMSNGLTGLVLPLSLVFYGLALYNAGSFTYRELKMFGLLEIGLGLLSACFIAYSLQLWIVGFGLLHMVYGIYIHFRYER
jgi:uncharacterized membrane protein YidH (DUF202 family)